jgi:hypothetical protein
MTTPIIIGKAQYGSRKKNNFRLQEGSTIARILPPFGACAAKGIWATFEGVHWGYKGSLGMKPFKCPQKKNFKTKMVEVQCPECDKIAAKKKLHDEQKKALEEQGKTPEQVKEQLKPLADWLFSHNLDKKWHMNVLMPDGKMGRLSIPHKMYQQLQAAISDLVEKKGIDPMSPDQGVQFEFIRTGKGVNTTHTIKVVEQEMTVDVGGKSMKVSTPKVVPLTEEVIGRLATEAYDLSQSAAALTFDQIKSLVESGGDSDIVDAVFGSGDVSDMDEPETTEATLPAAAPKAATPAPTPAPSETDEIAALKAKLAAAMSAKAATPSVVTPSAPAEAVKATPPAIMSDEDFIKQFGFSANSK